MDEQQLYNLIQNCRHLKYKFKGIFAANQFPLKIPRNSFIIVNASNSNSFGTHWLLLYKLNNDLLFADPLGFPIQYYTNCYKRIKKVKFKVLPISNLQPYNSNLCGLFCIFIAHALAHNLYYPVLDPIRLCRFDKHMY